MGATGGGDGDSGSFSSGSRSCAVGATSCGRAWRRCGNSFRITPVTCPTTALRLRRGGVKADANSVGACGEGACGGGRGGGGPGGGGACGGRPCATGSAVVAAGGGGGLSSGGGGGRWRRVAATKAGGPASVCDVVGAVAEVEPAVGCGEPAASAEAVAQVSVVGAAGRRVGRPTAARVADRQR